MKENRTICWFSAGAASAVATKIILRELRTARPVYCETGSEHPDNRRFITECESWFGKSIERLRSDEYEDTWDVWTRRKYLAGVNGAPCSVKLKIAPRLAFQYPTDVHVFGYTADASDMLRAARFRENFPEISLRTPLIENGLTKSACLELLYHAGIKLPVMYQLGFRNNNCIPCVKATSPAYWALVRQQFPVQFARMAKLSRELSVRLCRLNNRRAFIDEIPHNHPTVQKTSLSCDFLCHLAKDATATMTKENEFARI